MIAFFNTFFYDPLYNVLVFLIEIMPGGNVGYAIILLTIFVKTVLYPLSKASLKTQIEMRKIDPELKEIREKYKNNKEEQARKTMELYKKKNIHPFSGCLPLLIQLPIIFALYFVFFKGLGFNEDILYSFVSYPQTVNMSFLGIDLIGKSIILAFLAGITQYFQIRFSVPLMPPVEKKGDKVDFKDEFMRNMNLQMRYVFPVIVFVISYTISAAVALYWVVNNLYSIAQELYIRRGAKKEEKLAT